MHRPIFPGHDQVDPCAQRLFRRVAEQSLGAGVPKDDPAVWARVHDPRMAVPRESGAERAKVLHNRHDVSFALLRSAVEAHQRHTVAAFAQPCALLRITDMIA